VHIAEMIEERTERPRTAVAALVQTVAEQLMVPLPIST
jgi:hypothetical protein